MKKVEGIKIIKVDLGNFPEIELYTVVDLHWSSPETDENRFKHFVRFILEQPNRFLILDGDLLDMALAVSVSDSYAQEYSPSESVNNLADILKPIAHRVLAMGTGNHEDRVYKYTGIDVSEFLAMKSGVGLDRYSNNSFLLFITFGANRKSEKVTYSGFFHHGVGGGRMKGGKMNMVVRMAEIVNADMFAVGHVHDPMATSTKTFLIDELNKTIYEHKQYYIILNAWQKYGGYGQKFGYRPSAEDLVYYKLRGDRKSVTYHSLDFDERTS